MGEIDQMDQMDSIFFHSNVPHVSNGQMVS